MPTTKPKWPQLHGIKRVPIPKIEENKYIDGQCWIVFGLDEPKKILGRFYEHFHSGAAGTLSAEQLAMAEAVGRDQRAWQEARSARRHKRITSIAWTWFENADVADICKMLQEYNGPARSLTAIQSKRAFLLVSFQVFSQAIVEELDELARQAIERHPVAANKCSSKAHVIASLLKLWKEYHD